MRSYIFSDKDLAAIRVRYWEKKETPHFRKVMRQTKKVQKRLLEEVGIFEYLLDLIDKEQDSSRKVK